MPVHRCLGLDTNRTTTIQFAFFAAEKSRKGHRRIGLEQFDAALEMIAEKKTLTLEEVWRAVRHAGSVTSCFPLFLVMPSRTEGVVVGPSSTARKQKQCGSMMTRASTLAPMRREGLIPVERARAH